MLERFTGRVVLMLVAAVATVVTALALIAGPALAGPTCDTWNGSTGDWTTNASWSAGVPTSSSNVCIESGTVTISAGDPGANNVASLDIAGTAGSTAQLVVDIHNIVNSANTTIGSGGTLTLNGTYTGTNAGNAALGGGPVDNKGTIVMEGSGYSATLYGTVLNQGTISIPNGDVSLCQGGNGGTGSLDNQGLITLAAPPSGSTNPAELDVEGCTLTNDTGGQITNNATIKVFGENGTAGTFTQGAGNESGNAIQTYGSAALAYTGTGASSVEVHNSLTMTGNLSASQTLQADIGVVITEPGSFSSAGQINLIPNYNGGGGGPAEIALNSGTFTNTGTLTASSNNNNPELSGNVVNNGLVVVTPNTTLEQAAGTFTNGSGTIAPQITSSQLGTLQIDGGANFVAGGTLSPTPLSGFTPAVGQLFNVINMRGGSYSGTFAATAPNWFADYASSSSIGAMYGKAPAGPTSTTTTTTQTTTTPPPSTKEPTPSAPRVSSLHGGSGVIEAKLDCASKATCATYTITGTITEHVVVKGKKKTKVVTVASGHGTLKAEKTSTVKLTLNATGRVLLKHARKLKIAVTISANHKVLKRSTVTVTEPPAKKKKK